MVICGILWSTVVHSAFIYSFLVVLCSLRLADGSLWFIVVNSGLLWAIVVHCGLMGFIMLLS